MSFSDTTQYSNTKHLQRTESHRQAGISMTWVVHTEHSLTERGLKGTTTRG